MDFHPFIVKPMNSRHGTGNFVTNKRPEFEGPMKDLIEITFETTFGMKDQYNFSILDGKGSGCLKSVIDNMTDAYSYPIPVPVANDALDIATIVGQSKIHFSIGYSYDDSSWDGDISDSIGSFCLFLWSLLFITFFILWILFKLDYDKINIKNQTIFSEMFGHFMYQNSMNTGSLLLVMNLTIFSFLVHILFNCVVKTDLITTSKPRVPYSHKDIIDYKTPDISMLNGAGFSYRIVLKVLSIENSMIQWLRMTETLPDI